MSPAEAVRHRLAFCRAAGWRFESAWERAVHTPLSYPGLPPVAWGGAYEDQTDWQTALEATKAHWEKAFNREPPPPGIEAFAVLAEHDPPDLREERDPPPAPPYVAPITHD